MLGALRNFFLIASLFLCTFSGFFMAASCSAGAVFSSGTELTQLMCHEFSFQSAVPSVIRGHQVSVMPSVVLLLVVAALVVLVITVAPRFIGRAQYQQRLRRLRWVWSKPWPFSFFDRLKISYLSATHSF